MHATVINPELSSKVKYPRDRKEIKRLNKIIAALEEAEKSNISDTEKHNMEVDAEIARYSVQIILDKYDNLEEEPKKEKPSVPFAPPTTIINDKEKQQNSTNVQTEEEKVIRMFHESLDDMKTIDRSKLSQDELIDLEAEEEVTKMMVIEIDSTIQVETQEEQGNRELRDMLESFQSIDRSKLSYRELKELETEEELAKLMITESKQAVDKEVHDNNTFKLEIDVKHEEENANKELRPMLETFKKVDRSNLSYKELKELETEKEHTKLMITDSEPVVPKSALKQSAPEEETEIEKDITELRSVLEQLQTVNWRNLSPKGLKDLETEEEFVQLRIDELIDTLLATQPVTKKVSFTDDERKDEAIEPGTKSKVKD